MLAQKNLCRGIVVFILGFFGTAILLYSSGESDSQVREAAGSRKAGDAKTAAAVVAGQLGKNEDPSLLPVYNPIPQRDFSTTAKYAPQNMQDESGYAFALFYCTREPSLSDPYFEATQNIIWRILWSDYRSVHPVIVFVCPFTLPQQRIILRGQGAIVKETELRNFVPVEKIPVVRWQDQFSKLNMWKETQFKRIAFMDSDAFPIWNVDDVFDKVPERECVMDSLSPEDHAAALRKGGSEFCNYVYGGVDPFGKGEVNGGFLLFKPNMLMYEKLTRAAKDTEHYDFERMEQGLLHSKMAFGPDGPFPATFLPQTYNANPVYYRLHRDNASLRSKDGDIRILHQKLWNPVGQTDMPELNMLWDGDWMKMCRFYGSPRFLESRKLGRAMDDFEWFFDKMPTQAAKAEAKLQQAG